jgi:DNA-directed RNA polymerase subunit beta'
MIPKWRHLNVFEGEKVEKGEVLADGPESAHDILRLRVSARSPTTSPTKCRTFTVCKALRSTTSIEVIVRQMLRKCEILSAGDTDLIEGEQVEVARVKIANRKLVAEEELPTSYPDGYYQASPEHRVLHLRGFFQETTRADRSSRWWQA